MVMKHYPPEFKAEAVASYRSRPGANSPQETFSASVGGSGATMARALGAQPMLRKDDLEHTAERAPANPTLRLRRIREVLGCRSAADSAARLPGFGYADEQVERAVRPKRLVGRSLAGVEGGEEGLQPVGLGGGEPGDDFDFQAWNVCFEPGA